MAEKSKLSALLSETDNVRNVCIIAHIDHGKTTLSDQLIAAAAVSPNILSKKLAGQARYLDSRQDEQERAITMKASSILLKHHDNLVALTDSPGHVDFSGEVSVAARLADGAVLLLDACEGIGAQTRTVLTQAWREGLKVVLCINKIDRLIIDLKLQPLEAFEHLRRCIEQLNAFASSLHIADVMEVSSSETHLDIDDSHQITFSPELGNVVFCSAIDGWGFSIPSAAAFFAEKLGMSANALKKALWGDFYYDSKSKTVSKKVNKSGKPLFVQFLLENIWKVYKDVLEEQHLQKMKNIISSLDLKIPPRELMTSEWRLKLQAIMSRWLNLSESMLDMIVVHLPSPKVAQSARLKNVWSKLCVPEHKEDDLEALKTSVEAVDNSNSAPVVVFVAKMVSISCTFADIGENAAAPKTSLIRRPYQRGKFTSSESKTTVRDQSKEENPSVKEEPKVVESEMKSSEEGTAVDSKEETPSSRQFIGFSRVLCGLLRADMDLWATLPKGDVVQIPANTLKLYILMGRDLIPAVQVPAGVVCGIGGLDDFVLSYSTISSLRTCPPLNPMMYHSAPILKVAVYPGQLDTGNLHKLDQALKLLGHADPNVEVYLEKSGEHVIVACGELHLERCLADLRERFCPNMDIKVSSPIVSFQECIGGSLRNSKLETKSTANKWVSFSVRAFSIIPEISQRDWKVDIEEDESNTQDEIVLIPDEEELRKMARSVEKYQLWKASSTGKNFLYWGVNDVRFFSESCEDSDVVFFREISSSVIQGFEMAMKQGSLCAEPVVGVGIIIEDISLERPETWRDLRDPYGPITGQVVSAFNECCRNSMLQQTPLLVEGMFRMELQCTSDMLGKLFGFLDQRRGRVIKEEIYAGTDLFMVEGFLPVVESLGFALEVRRKTRGSANPMLILDHWEVLNDLILSGNLVNQVRKRKGLAVQEQVVLHAEKQRTRKK